MKRIKLLITLSLTFLVLAFGSVSVFALDVTVGDVVSSGDYVFSDNIHLDDLTSSVSLSLDFVNLDKEYSQILFYYSNDSSGFYSVAYRPKYDDDPAQNYSVVTGWLDDSYRYIYIVNDTVVLNEDYVKLFSLLSSVDTIPSGSGLAEDIFQLFQSIISWMVGFFGVFVGLFWTSAGGLTFLGVLTVIALGISIFFFIFAVVINFFRFRGR